MFARIIMNGQGVQDGVGRLKIDREAADAQNMRAAAMVAIQAFGLFMLVVVGFFGMIRAIRHIRNGGGARMRVHIGKSMRSGAVAAEAQ